jgi:hypothetical protein
VGRVGHDPTTGGKNNYKVIYYYYYYYYYLAYSPIPTKIVSPLPLLLPMSAALQGNINFHLSINEFYKF